MTETGKPPLSRLQRGWLIVYWLAPLVVLLLLLQAIFTFTADLFPSIVALVLASTSMALGLTFSTRLVKSRPDDLAFLKGTTTVRIIAIAWLMIGLAVPSGVIVATLAEIEDITALDWSAGFASTAGSLSILAILGPGYVEYREAMKQTKSAREHATQADR